MAKLKYNESARHWAQSNEIVRTKATRVGLKIIKKEEEMNITRSDLTGKIYMKKREKVDVTDEVVLNIQILLHQGFKFNALYSKEDGKLYELVLREKS